MKRQRKIVRFHISQVWNRYQRTSPLYWLHQLVTLWYRIATPPLPSQNVSVIQQEVARRGRLVSVVALFQLVLVLAAIPFSIQSNYVILSGIQFLDVVLYISALVFNRQGKTFFAGLFLITGCTVGLVTACIFQASQGLSLYGLSFFDLLVENELLAVSLFAPETVFLFALGDTVFTCIEIAYHPRTAELSHFFLQPGAFYGAMLKACTLFGIVAVIPYLWVRSANRAIEHAERAQVTSQLENMQRNQEITTSIRRICQLLAQAAQNPNTYLTISKENPFWEMGIFLNTLLKRYRRNSDAEARALALQREIEHLTEELHSIRKTGRYTVLPVTGTELDPLILEMNAHLLSSTEKV